MSIYSYTPQPQYTSGRGIESKKTIGETKEVNKKIHTANLPDELKSVKLLNH